MQEIPAAFMAQCRYYLCVLGSLGIVFSFQRSKPLLLPMVAVAVVIVVGV